MMMMSRCSSIGPRYLSTATTWRTLSNDCIKAPAAGVRCKSTVALGGDKQQEEKQAVGAKDAKGIISYWGLEPTRVSKEDGRCPMEPWEAYSADLTIDLKKHHEPATLLDKMAYWTVKALRWPTDVFFQRRYGCRAMMLETVAVVPGMVGGLLLHCKSLRRFEHS
ncbi:hypothetical protein GQ457_04G000600 [Hibiscus cannabinus]